MSSPTRTPAARRAAAGRPSRSADEPHGLAAAPPRLKLALGLAVVAAIAAAIALPLGILKTAPAPGFSSSPILLALALLPVLLAIGLTAADRPVTGARVLIGAALLAPGALLFDLQLLLDSTRVARPELVMPTSLAGLSPALGGWVLVASHVVALAAGLCAAGYAGAIPGSDFAEAVDNPDRPRDIPAARRMLGLSLVCGVVIAIGALMPPLYSHNALLVAVDVVPDPWLVRAGGIAVALLVPVALAWSAGTGNRQVHLGVSLGVLTGVAALAVPPLAAGLFMSSVAVAPGPIVALVGALLAVGVSLLEGKAAEDEDPHEAELTLPGNRLHQVAGVLGVLLAIAAVISALTAIYTARAGSDPGAPVVVGEPTKLALAAGLVVGVLGLVVAFGGRAAPAARPAFVVALAALALPAATTLDDALSVTKARDSLQGQSVPGADSWMTLLVQGQTGPSAEQISFGPAFWLSVLLLGGAALAAVVAAVAGVAEREDLDLADRPDNQILWAPAVLAGLAAIGAFGLPLLHTPAFQVSALFSNPSAAAWGQLIAMLAVVVAVVVAPRARPARGAALLLGAAAVVGVQLLQLPFAGARVPQASPATGWWLATLTLALLLVAAFVAGTAESDQRKR